VSHVFTTYMVAKVGAHLYPLPSWEPIVQTVTHLRQPRAAAHHSARANGCAHVETGLIRGTVHCHENVTQRAENGGKNAANDNKGRRKQVAGICPNLLNSFDWPLLWQDLAK
jgi:hypothetical protein